MSMEMESSSVKYARQILAAHGCDEYTYGDTPAEKIMDDLKIAFPDGMEFPYIEVCNAIISISKRKPLVRPKYRVLWDTDSCCDSYEVKSLEQGKASAEDTLVEWATELSSTWKDGVPTEEQIREWDYMVWNCSAVVEEYDPDTDEYFTVFEPDYDAIGFILWDELKKRI